jgi:hypothetical protein
MKNIAVWGIVAIGLLASCSGRVEGSLHADGAADLSLRASLEPRMSGLIRSLSRLNSGSDTGEVILNGPAIASSMSAAPGIKTVSFHNINPTTIEGTISIVQVNAFLSIPGNQGGGDFISYEQTATGGKCMITLNRSTGPRIIAVLSPDVTDYLSALMAPVVTGEVLSKTEYLSLVRSVYGRNVADEIGAARIQASIDFPRPISAIRGGVIAGISRNRGEFTIALVDLLVLENPLEYEVSWK